MSTRPEQGFWGRAATIGAPFACAAALGGPLVNSAAWAESGAPDNPCTRYGYLSESFKACASYIFASQFVLKEYLRFGNQDLRNPRGKLQAQFTRDMFEDYYFGQPREKYKREVTSWPKTPKLIGNVVRDTVDIVKIVVPVSKRVYLTTEESRVVIDRGNDKVRYSESTHIARTTLCEMPNRSPITPYVVVANGFTSISCQKFAKAHSG